MHFQNISRTSPRIDLETKEENFEIFVRLKPVLTEQEAQVLKHLSDTKLEIVSPYYHEGERVFQFDKVFSTNTTNQTLFQTSILSPIHNVFAGFNSTVLIYGATGAGKTYTMFGNQKQRGIVPRSLQKIFQIIQSSQSQCQLYLSFYEIYNETIRDLLQQQASPLNIMEDPNRGTIINELSEHILQTQEEALFLLSQGIQHRAMNATKSNQVSSRSHAIFQLTLKQYSPTSKQKFSVTQSKLFLIDLAGNEKSFQNCTNLDKRFVQGININKSLLTLGKCINILAQRKNQFVPFRDSKLTRILKQSLGGNSKTIMIACVSMQNQFYQQILNTLKYCSLAKNIKNKRVKNIKQIDNKSIGSFQIIKTNRHLNNSNDLLLNNLISSVQDKMKTQNILQNLMIAKQKNESVSKIGQKVHYQKLSQINRFIDEIKKHHEDAKQRVDYFETQIKDSISNQKQQIYDFKNISEQYSNSLKQIERLKTQIKQKDKRINILQRPQTTHVTSIGSTKQASLTKSLSRSTIKINPISKKSMLQIDVKSSLNFQKQNISGASKLFNKKKQIIIDLNNKQTKDQFVQDLKAAEKRIKQPNSHRQIQRLMSLQQLHQYDLNNVQQSIFRKLRFFQQKKGQPTSNDSRYALKGLSLGKNGR